MPDYASILRNGVATLAEQFEGMKLNIAHTRWVGQDGEGADLYETSDPVTRRALVDLTRKQVYTPSGALAMTVAKLTFLDPIADHGAAGRQEPIDTRDILTLPDGTTAPIVSVGGPADSATNRPFLNEATLGVIVRGG